MHRGAALRVRHVCTDSVTMAPHICFVSAWTVAFCTHLTLCGTHMHTMLGNNSL